MWETTKWKACQAPLPVDMKGMREELDYLQRQLTEFNSKLKQPRSEKNIKIPEWSCLDDGIDVLLKARMDVIDTRQRWLDEASKRGLKPNKPDKG